MIKEKAKRNPYYSVFSSVTSLVASVLYITKQHAGFRL